MTNTAIIETIKKEKINTMCEFHHDDNSIRAIYLCTMKGTEFTLEENFISHYGIESKDATRFNSSGWLEKDLSYTITEKENNTVIYTQS